ncbi:MAG: hypothetical protein H5U40_10570, partial [Polyangiaceae bacterium]|nr:hypothetical protein [Polyangiaceae bacterium]
YVTSTPAGYANLHGLDGELRPIDATITDDPIAAQGSGADRLRSVDGQPRISLHVLSGEICSGDNPPSECEALCNEDVDCPDGFLCGVSKTCVGRCDENIPPPPVVSFAATTHPDEKSSHHWARLVFVPAQSRRNIVDYRIKVSEEPIVDDADFVAARNANAAAIDTIGLSVCRTEISGNIVCPSPGAATTADMGQLVFETRYHVAMRPVDECGIEGPFVTAEVETTPIHFTTVSPCFVATAAYGSPMAAEVETLRAFRDRYLMTNPPGRAFVSAYYAVGPYLADAIRGSEDLRAASRLALAPFVALAHSLLD